MGEVLATDSQGAYMSELKVYHHELRHNEYEEFYLKYEADKVIAELKESVKGLILDNYLKDKETRHNKYKRCLAMARCCNRMFSSTFGKERYWQKWNRRWLELAEKFKETK
jgi:hypothetical protein